MIVPMKKITLLMSAHSSHAALQVLRRMGILHVKHIQPPQGEDLDALLTQSAQADRALKILNVQGGDVKHRSIKFSPDEIIEDILAVNQELSVVQTRLHDKKETAQWFETWGDVSPASVAVLQEKGVFIRFYTSDTASLKKLPDDKQIRVIKESGSTVYLAFFAGSEEEKLDFKEAILPDIEPGVLKQEIRDLNKQIAKLHRKLADMTVFSESLRKHMSSIEKKIELCRILNGMGNEEAFAYLQGFCPEETVPELKKTADREGWGYIIQDPDNPAEVPTLLKNSRFLRIIEPLFQFMGILPGYHEQDVSLVFLLFFSVFYAMIIGDAGYGLVFLGLTAFLRSKNRKAPSEPFMLFYILSVTTIIWGVLTGTWFGSRAIAQWAPVQKFIIEPMFSFNESREAQQFMMRFSFFLGLIHLMIAHFMSSLKKWPSLKAVAEWGWILICAGMFFVVDLLVLSNPMPVFATILMITGLVIVGIFTNFQKHPLKLLGSFIGTLLNSIQSVIASFSDIVSYIRLFAVGLAGVTVAASFNGMANGLAAPIILVLGHGLNIILGMMSVIVHGVRLNMLEYSGHLGQEWTGHPYKPFKE